MGFIKIGDAAPIIKTYNIDEEKPTKIYYDEEGNIVEEPTFEELTMDEVVIDPKGKN